VGRAELLEAGDEFFWKFSLLLGLLRDLIKKAIQFRVDLKERICCCNRDMILSSLELWSASSIRQQFVPEWQLLWRLGRQSHRHGTGLDGRYAL